MQTVELSSCPLATISYSAFSETRATIGPRTTHPCTVHRSDLKTRRIERTNLFLQLLRVVKRLVAKIHVPLERERELALEEQLGRNVVVVEPCEDGLEGIQTPIEGEHMLWSERFTVHRYFGFCWSGCVEGVGGG